MISGTYAEGKSFLHNLDPRVKIFHLLFIAALFFLPLPLYKYYAFIILLFTAGTVSLGAAETIKPVKVILPLLVLIMLLTPPFHIQGEVYLILFGRPFLTSEGLSEAFHLAGRFIGITLVFFLFLRTTRIEDFVLSLRFFGLSYRIALVISLTVRSIPSIASMYENTREAHRMRLTEHSPVSSAWNLPARFNKVLSVLTSVMIQAIKSIPVLAMALETRGVGRNARPGRMKQMKNLKETAKEIAVSFSLLLIMLYFILN